MFFWISASVANKAAVSPNGIKPFLANDASIFFINGKENFINGPRSLLSFDLQSFQPFISMKNQIVNFNNDSNPFDYTILDSWVFDNFILADELFTKPWNLSVY